MGIILPDGLQNILARLRAGERVSLWDPSYTRQTGTLGSGIQAPGAKYFLEHRNQWWLVELRAPGAQRVKKAFFELRWFCRDKEGRPWPYFDDPELRAAFDKAPLPQPGGFFGLNASADFYKGITVDPKLLLPFVDDLTRHLNVKKFAEWYAGSPAWDTGPRTTIIKESGQQTSVIPLSSGTLTTPLSIAGKGILVGFGQISPENPNFGINRPAGLWAYPNPVSGEALRQIDANSPAPFVVESIPHYKFDAGVNGQGYILRWAGSDSKGKDLYNREAILRKLEDIKFNTPPPPATAGLPQSIAKVSVPDTISSVSSARSDALGLGSANRTVLLRKIFEAIRTGDKNMVKTLLKTLGVI